MNCLLCFHCDIEEGSLGFYCDKRDLEDDKRFPYKNTKCKSFKEDKFICSLVNKKVDKTLWNTITWETY